MPLCLEDCNIQTTEELDSKLLDTAPILRYEALTNLYYLAKHVLGYSELEEAIHKPLCDLVQSINPVIIAQAGARCPLFHVKQSRNYMQSLGLPHVDTISPASVLRGGGVPVELDSLLQNSMQNLKLNRLSPYTVIGKGLERLFLLHRGSFKTTIISVAHTVQLMLLWPEIRILINSHKKEGGSQPILGAVRTHFKANRELRALFPEYAPQPNGVGIIDFGTQDKVYLPNRLADCAWPEATVEVAGLTTDVTGRHYNYIKNDDLVTRDSVTNENMIQKTRDFKSLQPFLFDQPEWGVTDNIGTIYHFNDLWCDLDKTDITKVKMPVWNERDEIIFHERFTYDGIAKIQREIGDYEFHCNPGHAPIWMADGTFKRIDEIVVGDKVIGWAIGDNRRKLCETTVQFINCREAEVQTMEMSNGDEIQCTPEHKWYTNRHVTDSEPHRKEYAPAKEGSTMFKVIDPINDMMFNPFSCQEIVRLYSWLAGFIDGEGACKHGSHIIIVQALSNKECIEKLEYVLDKLQIEYSKWLRPASEGHQEANVYTLKGGRQYKVNIINYGNPGKSQQIMDTMIGRGGDFCRDKVTVKKILKARSSAKVYSMQTETGNYVVWGYASSNCQYLLNPVPPESQTFKPQWLERDGFRYDEAELEGRPLRINVFIDPASKRRKTSDYTAWFVIGVDSAGTKFLLDVGRDKLATEDRTNLACDLCEKWGTHTIHYETIGFQDTDKYIIDRKMRERKYYINVVEIKASSTSKEDRIKGLQPLYQRGDIRWPKSCSHYSTYHGRKTDMLAELRDEMYMFPKCVHDDMLDVHSFMLRIDEYNAGATPSKPAQHDRLEEIRQKCLVKKKGPRTFYKKGGTLVRKRAYELPAARCII